tara:strand:+ start:3222 stop:4526 length:1305 start_codon:yes stop_codon:yes gene_type:complete
MRILSLFNMSIKNNYKVSSIKKDLTYEWILKKHYSGRLPSICFSFGLFKDNILVGVITFGMPPSMPLAESIAGKKYSNLVLELNRLVTNDNLDKNALSYFVSKSISKLPKPIIIVSFSDNNMSHNGYIYQATNFIYTGKTANNSMYIDKDGKEFHFRNLGHIQEKLTKEINIKKRIINSLSDDLLKKEYLNIKGKNKFTGHCYIASECYYHLTNKNLKVYHIKHENSTHWFIRDDKGKIIDLTAGQFKSPVPYEEGRRGAFLTKAPSKRCKILIDRVVNDGFSIVKRRLNEDRINKIEIANYLKENKGDFTAKKLDKLFGYKDTAPHWFRTDNCFSFANVDDWKVLKELLKLDNKYDNIMLEFEWVASVSEIREGLQLKKVDILPKNRYIFISAIKRDKKVISNTLKYISLPYPKEINKNYNASYNPVIQMEIF